MCSVDQAGELGVETKKNQKKKKNAGDYGLFATGTIIDIVKVKFTSIKPCYQSIKVDQHGTDKS